MDEQVVAAYPTPRCYDCGVEHDGAHSEQFCSEQCRQTFMWSLLA